MRSIVIVMIALVLGVAGGPVSGLAPRAVSARPRPPTPPVRADITFFAYKPNRLRIRVGMRVVWTNRDSAPHSVTHGTAVRPGTAFDSGLFGRGKSYGFTFTKAGVYPYYCTIHPSMLGVVRVAP